MRTVKRITALVIALLLPITLLCGCSGDRLTAQEYSAQMQQLWSEYNEGLMAEYLLLREVFSFEDEKVRFEVAKSSSAKALEALSNTERTLSQFRTLTPPSDYTQLHARLLSAIDGREHAQIELRRNFWSATTFSEYSAANNAMNKNSQEVTSPDFHEDTFPKVYAEIFEKFRSDGLVGS